MPIRTTEELVAGVIEWDDEIPLEPFISAASSLVDRIQKVALDNVIEISTGESGDPDDDEILQQIETWLAAHFYAMRDPRFTSEHAGSVSATYQSKVDLNLYLSHYGQMAMVLDPTGTLKTMSSTKGTRRGSVTWAGKDTCE